jgi:hypothetical protein
MEMAAKAPRIRNIDVMQMWFDAWNHDNERAREEYDRIRFEEGAIRKCRSGRHWLTAGNAGSTGRCLICRNLREKERRKQRPIPSGDRRVKLTPEREAEICRRYTSGESIKTVQKAVGCGPDLVIQALDRNNISTRTAAEAARMRWRRSA